MLATLFNVPRTPEELSEMSFANMDEHFKIAAAIQRILGLEVTVFPLDPIPIADIGPWSYNHQDMHNQQNAILGIAGNDLTDVDFSKPEEIATWSYIHANEHVLAAQILGLD